MRFFSLERR